MAVARFLYHLPDPRAPELMAEKHEKGYAALNIMEQHLGARDYFVADQYTIADIALYAYTHVAEKGKFDLSGYPNIRSWLDRVRERPGHVAMGVG